MDGLGKWYGLDAPTQNIAEAQAMLDGLAYIRQRQLQGEHVLVLGDSELVINFLTRAYKPKLRELVVRVQTPHEWQREWRRAGGPHLEF